MKLAPSPQTPTRPAGLTLHRWADIEELPVAPGDTFKKHRAVGRPHAAISVHLRVPDRMVRPVSRMLIRWWSRRS